MKFGIVARYMAGIMVLQFLQFLHIVYGTVLQVLQGIVKP